MDEQIPQGISRVDPEDSDRMEKAADWLHEQLDFPTWDCGTALVSCNGDIGKAAEQLASGAWMRFKLVSWNWESLRKSTEQLAVETGLPEHFCEKVLRNCGGNLALAKRKIACLPALERLPASLD